MSTLTLVEPTVIETALQKANLTEQVLAELKEKYMPMKVTDKVTRREADEARKDCKKVRVLTEKTCKEGREEAIKIQKDWIAAEKKVTGQISEVEEHLEAEIKAFDDAIAAEAAEKLRIEQERIQARVKQLTDNGCLPDGVNYSIAELTISQQSVASMADADFTEFVNKAKGEFAKQLEAQAEAERLEAEEKQRQEALRIENERKEKELLEKTAEIERREAAIREAEAKEQQRLADVERERIAAIMNTRISELKGFGLVEHSHHYSHPIYDCTAIVKETIEIASDSDWDEIITLLTQRIEEGKAEAEAKRLAELEAAKEQARKEEQARIEAENKRIAEEQEASRIEAARQAALAPDKDKLIAFADALTKLELPTLEADDAKKIADDVKALIAKITNHIHTKVKSL